MSEKKQPDQDLCRCRLSKNLHTLSVVGAYDRFFMQQVSHPEAVERSIKQTMVNALADLLLKDFPIKESIDHNRNTHNFTIEVTVLKK